MSPQRPWQGDEVLLLGHSLMEGFGPALRDRFQATGARIVHLYAQRGISVRTLQQQVRGGLQVIPRSVADKIPVVVVSLSGNGSVLDALELRANTEWLRAEYPRALIIWLGQTITRTGTVADQYRAHAAEFEAQLISTLERFLWVDLRMPTLQLAPDGIHPTGEGYRLLAERIWTQVLAGTKPRPSSWPMVLGGAAALGLAAFAGHRVLRREER